MNVSVDARARTCASSSPTPASAVPLGRAGAGVLALLPLDRPRRGARFPARVSGSRSRARSSSSTAARSRSRARKATAHGSSSRCPLRRACTQEAAIASSQPRPLLALGGSHLRTRCVCPARRRCPIFPATNAWNERVDTLPVAANSAQLIAVDRAAATGLASRLRLRPLRRPADRHPVRRRVEADAALASSRSTTPTSRTRGRTRSRRAVHIEGGRASDRRPARAAGRQGRVQALRALCALPEGRRLEGGLRRDLESALERAATRGLDVGGRGGLPIFPGLARYDEVARGVIDHALRFTAARTRSAVRLSRAPRRVELRRSVAAADGRCASG